MSAPTDITSAAIALIHGPLCDALDAAGFRHLADEGRALDAAGERAWYRALCWARDRGTTAERAGGWLGVRVECLAWAARGMLLRVTDPDEARAFGAAWCAEADRYDGAARCWARTDHIRGNVLAVDALDRCPSVVAACRRAPQQIALFAEVA